MDQNIITAESGQDVTLTCRAPNNNILVVEWSRADLGDENVLIYYNGKFVPDDQHPSFKNRVDLQDRQMKDGDVSLILRDVTTTDDGTYMCRVFIGAQTWKLVSIINLNVPPGQTGGQEKDEDDKDGGKEAGSVGLIVGLLVSAVLVVFIAILGFLIYRKKHQPSKEHPADQHSKQPLQT
ncbi:CD226 antigen-like [Neolamprologus brichardi]|uniref:CD226 antigen-like n=1 Tax=Neolamprologus brichardi TaxID=32507 RepID=UPI0016439499|nr:CD226 antigen-like [Neolamprologus brichardi]